MKTTRNIKRTLSLILALLICMSNLTIGAYASESDTDLNKIVSTEAITPRNGNITFNPNDNPNPTIHLSGRCTKVIYTCISSNGSDGIIVLRFTKSDNSDMKSFTFLVDGKEHTEDLGYALQAGNYHISIQACTTNCKSVNLNFR